MIFKKLKTTLAQCDAAIFFSQLPKDFLPKQACKQTGKQVSTQASKQANWPAGKQENR